MELQHTKPMPRRRLPLLNASSMNREDDRNSPWDLYGCQPVVIGAFELYCRPGKSWLQDLPDIIDWVQEIVFGYYLKKRFEKYTWVLMWVLSEMISLGKSCKRAKGINESRYMWGFIRFWKLDMCAV